MQKVHVYTFQIVRRLIIKAHLLLCVWLSNTRHMLLSSRVRILAGLLLCGGTEALGATHTEAYARTESSHIFKGSAHDNSYALYSCIPCSRRHDVVLSQCSTLYLPPPQENSLHGFHLADWLPFMQNLEKDFRHIVLHSMEDKL